jgi:hypothetical protein
MDKKVEERYLKIFLPYDLKNYKHKLCLHGYASIMFKGLRIFLC